MKDLRFFHLLPASYTCGGVQRELDSLLLDLIAAQKSLQSWDKSVHQEMHQKTFSR